ncbi:phage tail tip protein [Escherichia coli]
MSDPFSRLAARMDAITVRKMGKTASINDVDMTVMPDDGAPFRYSFSALKDRHNAVEVNWIDPDNGWETATELVEDTQAILRYGRNVTKMDAFGCTSRGQAHRAGLWLIKTELLETQTVDFSVGAEGLRHVPGDVIEICDDDYAGISTGGRVLAVNSQTRTLTLDREITLPSSGTTLISLVDGSGNPVSVEVQSVTDGVKVKVSRVPDGVAGYSVWGLKLPTLRQRLFRCVSIRENDDGTYAITAVQHVPEKEAIVDNGAHFDGDQSATVNGVTPPAVQHLTAEVTADSGEYQVLARWDTPKVVKGVSFLLRLTVAADDGSERLVSTARTTETTYRFTQLALGNYRLTVRAVNAWGQQGDPASVSFRIAAPAAPSRIELTPGYFQITATPHLAVYDPTVQFEFWFSEKRIADIRQVETTARYLGTALYWIAASINIKPGHDYYFYIRSVNTVGKSAFVEAVGQPSDDASGYLDFFKGEIGKTHLAQELWTQIDNGQLAPDLAEIRTSITDVSNEITQTVNKKLEDQSAAIQQIQKVQVDTNNNLNSMWAVKLQQMKDGRLYIAGIGAGIENTPAGMQSQVLLAADRIAMINPANGNTKPMFVGQGDQIFMNEVFLKRLTAPTITSGGNPPAFSLTPDGKLTAKNADISGSVNANSGTLNNVTINENCQIKGKLSANQIEGDIVKTVSKSFPRTSTYASGTITVRISDDQKFDRQVMIPPVLFRGGKHENFNSNNQQSYWYSTCRLRVTRNGQEIFNQSTTDAQGVFSSVIDMPAGQGTLTLTFTVSSSGANMRGWTIKGKPASGRAVLSQEQDGIKSHTHSASASSTDLGTKTTSSFDYGTKSTNNTGAHTHSVSGTAASAGAHTHSMTFVSGGSSGAPGSGASDYSKYSVNTSSAGAHTHSVSGTAASAGAHAHTVGIGAHTHSVAIGSHGHTITVNAAGNAENTVKNIAFNYIVRLA